jgi:hypothetical protein
MIKLKFHLINCNINKIKYWKFFLKDPEEVLNKPQTSKKQHQKYIQKLCKQVTTFQIRLNFAKILKH